MSCTAPVEALLVLDPMSIPEANTNFISYGRDSINVALEFYGNSKEDIYEGCTKISQTLLKCTKEYLRLKYAEYKGYVCTHCLELVDKTSGMEENIKSCTALTETKKYKSQKNNERNRERIVSNPRKKPFTLNSQ